MLGNILVGQSGGPTAVINSSLAGIFQTAKDRGAGRIYGMMHGVQGLLKKQIINLRDQIKDNLDIELLKRSPAAFLGSCRYKLPVATVDEEPFENIFTTLKELEIDAFFYIGGNDSMDTISKLKAYGEHIGSSIKFIGVPKTIDNDLAHTDHTPGFGSAAKYIAAITKEIIYDSLAYDSRMVTIVEIMGRNAGWLTGSSALSKAEDCIGPDMLFLPEIPFDLDNFVKIVEKRQKEKKNVFIAVSEGVKLADKSYVSELTGAVHFSDSFGHKSLSGTAHFLANYVATHSECKTRAIELSTLQRCASHIASRVDMEEAFQVGGAAVKAASEGVTGVMVTLERLSNDPYQCTTGFFDVSHIANVEKTVPAEWIDTENMYVTKEFLSYVRPLVQSELTPIMVEGLPRHLFNPTLAD